MATEVKEEGHKLEAKESVAEPPLKCKTWVLKVSVNCEGCKRKVNKILKNTEDVYSAHVDLRQQKVTVVGNIDPDILIKKLVKAGKHAELWPDQKSDQKDKNKKGKGKNKDTKHRDQESSEDGCGGGGGGGCEEEEKTAKAEVLQVDNPSKTSGNECGAANKNGGNSDHDVRSKSGEIATTTTPSKSSAQVKELKQTVTCPAVVNPSPVDNKIAADCRKKNDDGGCGGEKKKNNGHKGNNSNGDNGHHFQNANGSTGTATHRQITHGNHVEGQDQYAHPANNNPPRHDASPYSHYSASAYAVRHSASYPSTFYSDPLQSYAYMHPGTANQPPPPDFDEIFSDENPNACSVM
ncbi:hypothetical protein K2173_004812 [Erythroxylum novogranatense]|uniref:HMA domain-containing protein n=1 Tax=Erythroxylum novogranatense TaxID=1862640 RepID=A0AAV8SKJ3_9ROSI|nr:hypothetical protein K2173_004812 [Erythroxylum novogranatense]